jgi:hypothetical protein
MVVLDMMMNSYYLAAIGLVVYGIYRLLQVGKRDKRLPPGPPTSPIFGNALQIPPTGLGKKSVKSLSDPYIANMAGRCKKKIKNYQRYQRRKQSK